jgi:hypothetical protein
LASGEALNILSAMPPAGRDASSRFPEDHDLSRISTKGRDVLLHPLQARDQVQNAVVSGNVIFRFRRQTGVYKVAQGAHAIGGAHYNHTLAGKPFTGRKGTGGRASRKASSIDPDHHRQSVAGGLGRSQDIEHPGPECRRVIACGGKGSGLVDAGPLPAGCGGRQRRSSPEGQSTAPREARRIPVGSIACSSCDTDRDAEAECSM